MHIELNQEETDFLRELLDQANMSLREEVYKTEGVEWKRALKDRQHVLAAIRAKLAPR